jgi:Predicted membrane protein
MARSSNPVLSRPDAWQTAPVQSYTQYQTYAPGQGYPNDVNTTQFGQPDAPAGRMTLDDVITKTAITLGTVTVVAALTFFAANAGIIPLAGLSVATLVSALVAFGAAMVVSLRRKVNPGFVLAYAAIEGVFIGGVSFIYAAYFGNGILPAAVLGTLVAAGATLAAYKYFRIRVTGRFRQMVAIGTMAYAGVLLVNLVLSFFGLAFITAGNLTVWGLVASAIGVGLAVFNLILDFDFIEQGIAQGAVASESWRGAFGLTVTMVWLYIEMLRLLSYFNRN